MRSYSACQQSPHYLKCFHGDLTSIHRTYLLSEKVPGCSDEMVLSVRTELLCELEVHRAFRVCEVHGLCSSLSQSLQGDAEVWGSVA